MTTALVVISVTLFVTASVSNGAPATCTPLVANCSCQTQSVTTAQYTAAINSLRALIAPSLQVAGQRQGDLIGLIVRLAFHDSAEYDMTKGDSLRADGCVDVTQADNAGLAAGITQLQPVWLQHCSVFSRADFWQLAAVVALNMAEPSGTYTVPFSYGRVDAASCGGAAGRLPNAGRLCSF
jgi:catalase (peroxidase I)